MRLNDSTTYAVRMLYLLSVSDKTLMQKQEMTQNLGIPHHNFDKISLKLKRAGLLDSKIGYEGGYFLAKPAQQISLYDIISAMDDQIHFDNCLHEHGVCTLGTPDGCPISYSLSILQNFLDAYLVQISLHDLSVWFALDKEVFRTDAFPEKLQQRYLKEMPFDEKVQYINYNVELLPAFLRLHSINVAYIATNMVSTLLKRDTFPALRNELIELSPLIETCGRWHEIGYRQISLCNFNEYNDEDWQSHTPKMRMIDAEYFFDNIAHSSQFANEMEDAFWQHIKNCVLYHTEHYDGSGPRGLSGDEIPIGARIIAICCQYERLQTGELREGGLPHEEVMQILFAQAGTLFDPVLVDTFATMLNWPRP